MLAGFYTISSGLLANQKKLDVIGTNLVNSQTPGFRAERPVASTFGEALAIRGTGAPVTSIKNVETLFDSGNLKPTERSLDFAINGWGYFNVQAEGGENIVLTRNGQFDIDSEGYLILPGVGRVLGDAGPLLVESDDFEIKPDGSLVNGEGKNLGSLKISAPAEDVVLEKLESGRPGVRHPSRLAGAFQRGLQPGTHQADRSAARVPVLQHGPSDRRRYQSKGRRSNRQLIRRGHNYEQRFLHRRDRAQGLSILPEHHRK